MRSITRKLFKGEESNCIITKPAMAEEWDACLATLEDHSSAVDLVSFSPDGQRLASASDDTTVKIWDAMTGHCRATLESQILLVLFLTLASLATFPLMLSGKPEAQHQASPACRMLHVNFADKTLKTMTNGTTPLSSG
jgi:WD40 repeat protein